MGISLILEYMIHLNYYIMHKLHSLPVLLRFIVGILLTLIINIVFILYRIAFAIEYPMWYFLALIFPNKIENSCIQQHMLRHTLFSAYINGFDVRETPKYIKIEYKKPPGFRQWPFDRSGYLGMKFGL